MNLDELLDDYLNIRFSRVTERLDAGWPESGLPNRTDEWAEACHLGMMSSFHLAGESDQRGDSGQAQHWDTQGELWRVRSLACALHSGNLYAGAMGIVGLGAQAHYNKNWKLAVDIVNLAPALLDAAMQRNAQPSNPPLAEIWRVFHEQRAVFLCDAVRSGEIPGTLDEAISEAHRALELCKDDRRDSLRASLKVSGGIANMTYWNGDKEGAIMQTQAILEQARSEERLAPFKQIAETNLAEMINGGDKLHGYQIA
jgi:hypothetical protein